MSTVVSAPALLPSAPGRPKPGCAAPADADHRPLSNAAVPRLFSSDAANLYYNATTDRRALQPTRKKPPRSPKTPAPESALRSSHQSTDERSLAGTVQSARSIKSSGSRISWKPSKDSDDGGSETKSNGSNGSNGSDATPPAREGADEPRQPPSPPRKGAAKSVHQRVASGGHRGADNGSTDTLDGFYGDDDSAAFREHGKVAIDPREATRLRQLELASGACSVVTEIVSKKSSARSDCSVVTEIVSKKGTIDGEKDGGEGWKGTISYDSSSHVLNIPARASPMRSRRRASGSKDSSDDGSVSSSSSGSLARKLKTTLLEGSAIRALAPKTEEQSPKERADAYRALASKSAGKPPKSPRAQSSKTGSITGVPSVAPKVISIGGLVYKLASGSGGDSSVASSRSSRSSMSEGKLAALKKRAKKESKPPGPAETSNPGTKAEPKGRVGKEAIAAEGGGASDKLSLMKSVAFIISDNSSETGSRPSKAGVAGAAGEETTKDANAKSLKQLLTEALALSQEPEDIARYLIERGGEEVTNEFLARAHQLEAESTKVPPVASVDQRDNASTASSVTHHGENEGAPETAETARSVVPEPALKGASVTVMTPEEAAKLGSEEAEKDDDDASVMSWSQMGDEEEKSASKKKSPPKEKKAKKTPNAKKRAEGAELIDDALLASQLNRAVFDTKSDKATTPGTNGTDVSSTSPKEASEAREETAAEKSKAKSNAMGAEPIDDALLASRLNRAVFETDPNEATAPEGNSTDISTSSPNSIYTDTVVPSSEVGKEVRLEDYCRTFEANDRDGSGFECQFTKCGLHNSSKFACNPKVTFKDVMADVRDLANCFLCVCRDIGQVANEEVETFRCMDWEKVLGKDDKDEPTKEGNQQDAPPSAGKEKIEKENNGDNNEEEPNVPSGKTLGPESVADPQLLAKNEKEQGASTEEGQPRRKRMWGRRQRT